MTDAEVAARVGLKIAKWRYDQCVDIAKSNGTPFTLTFEQWWAIWDASGKFENRGRKKGQYCMACIEPKRGFVKGNVKIVTVEESRFFYRNRTWQRDRGRRAA